MSKPKSKFHFKEGSFMESGKCKKWPMTDESSKTMWRKSMVIGTYNYYSLLTDSQMLTHKKSTGPKKICRTVKEKYYIKGNTFLYNWHELESPFWVIKKSLNKDALKFKGVSDRVIYLVWQSSKNCKVQIIQVYASIDVHTDEEMLAVYRDHKIKGKRQGYIWYCYRLF